MLSGTATGGFEELILFSIKLNLTEKDNLIILGDMGLCWRKDKQDLEKFVYRWENRMAETPMLYFIDRKPRKF